MDPIEFQRRAADMWKLVSAKHGKVDLKMLSESRKFDRELNQEGAIKAMQYALTNPSDQKGIRERFNKQGDLTLGDDVQIGIRNDPIMGPVVVGYRVGKDGKQQLVFDGFQDLILPAMGPEAYALAMKEFKQLGITEKGATDRNDAKIAGDIKTTDMTNRTTLAAALIRNDGKNQNPDHEILKELTVDVNSKLMTNPNFALNPEARQQAALDTLETAQRLFDDARRAGRPIGHAKAAADAFRIVTKAFEDSQRGRR